MYNKFDWCSSVEISPTLAEKQKETVGEVKSHLSKFRVERRDATDRTGWGEMILHTIVLFFMALFVKCQLSLTNL